MRLTTVDIQVMSTFNCHIQMWKEAVGSLSHSSNSSCSLWLNRASVGGVASEASRHNTPSRAHALTKLVQSERKAGAEVAIIVS